MKPHVLILAAILCQLDNLIAAPLRAIPQDWVKYPCINRRKAWWICMDRCTKNWKVYSSRIKRRRLSFEKTVVKLLYNSDYLYFGIRCYDSEPDKIIAYQLNQALRSDDYVNIVIDTFNNTEVGAFHDQSKGSNLMDSSVLQLGIR